MTRRVDAVRICFTLAVLSLGCVDSTDPSDSSSPKWPDGFYLRVEPLAMVISLDSTALFAAWICPPVDDCVVNPKFAYASASPGVAAIDTTGNVTGVGLGTATITVTSRNLSVQVPVFVTLPGAFLASQPLGANDNAPFAVAINGDAVYVGTRPGFYIGSVSARTVNPAPVSDSWACDIRLSAAGDTIWTTGRNLSAVTMPAGVVVKISPNFDQNLCRFTRTRDGQAFLAGTHRGRIYSFNSSLEITATWETGINDEVTSVVASPTLDRAYATVYGHLIELELRNDTIVGQTNLIPLTTEGLVAISSDGTTLYVTDSFGASLHILRLADRHDEVVPLYGRPHGVALSPDGSTLIILTRGDWWPGGVFLYDLPTRSWTRNWKIPTNDVVNAVMSIDGTIVVTEGSNHPAVYFLQ